MAGRGGIYENRGVLSPSLRVIRTGIGDYPRLSIIDATPGRMTTPEVLEPLG
jgi:hypothetical protein